MWLFGYGSLIWRPDFPFADRRVSALRGATRRFWQGSPDHRGTPEKPGRVVTLCPAPRHEQCWGVAYRIATAVAPNVLAMLHRREVAGYRMHRVFLEQRYGGTPFEGWTFVAGPSNPNYRGPAPLSQIAAEVHTTRGKSGTNSDYVHQLANALTACSLYDAHVMALAALVSPKPIG